MPQKHFIYIKDAEFKAFHGVLRQENIVGNIFVVNIDIEIDFSQAVETDTLSHTVSYADIFNIIKKEMNITSRLIEHLAGRIINSILLQFPQITSIDLSITKKHPPLEGQTAGAGIRIVHTNSSRR